VCVCFFAGALGTNNPKISRHLSYLKRAGLVKGRRDGKWTHYSLVPPSDPIAADILTRTLEMIAADPEMSKDRRKLDDICCAPVNLVSIGRA
jgi:ArsR family transcriptional regulator